MRKFAISDVHGCALTFRSLLQQIAFSEEDELYLLGDYIDRGPDSKGVIDHILELQARGYRVHCLRGNHEQLLLDSFGNREQFQVWLQNGGIRTLESFNVESVFRIPKVYIDFFDELDYYQEVDQYILVHAGLNFAMPDPFSEKESMLWIRDWYPEIDETWLAGRTIVHGHTPRSWTSLQAPAKPPVVNIDCGCVFKGMMNGLGMLCALELTEGAFFFEPNVDY